jgi:hypothetical protein
MTRPPGEPMGSVRPRPLVHEPVRCHEPIGVWEPSFSEDGGRADTIGGVRPIVALLQTQLVLGGIIDKNPIES